MCKDKNNFGASTSSATDVCCLKKERRIMIRLYLFWTSDFSPNYALCIMNYELFLDKSLYCFTVFCNNLHEVNSAV